MKIELGTSLRHILRLRPVAVSLLERQAGYQCWGWLDECLRKFCAEFNLDSEALLSRLENLPPTPSDSDWANMPLFYLIDYLTADHIRFRDREMPAIDSLLREKRLPAYPDGYVVQLLTQEFRYFQAEFRRHMEEEETFLFPKIMRNEACLRHPELGPEAHKGSVNLYLRQETHKPELEFRRMIASIREKLRNQQLQAPAAELAAEMQNDLAAFEAKLTAHADLETNVLLPQAGWIEKELHKGAIGDFAF